MWSCSRGKAGPQRSCILQVQARQGSAFTESLGEGTDSETGMVKGSPEEDISVVATSERSSASRAASGESQRQDDLLAASCVHDGAPSYIG